MQKELFIALLVLLCVQVTFSNPTPEVIVTDGNSMQRSKRASVEGSGNSNEECPEGEYYDTEERECKEREERWGNDGLPRG